jgi:hypothetical protein
MVENDGEVFPETSLCDHNTRFLPNVDLKEQLEGNGVDIRSSLPTLFLVWTCQRKRFQHPSQQCLRIGALRVPYHAFGFPVGAFQKLMNDSSTLNASCTEDGNDFGMVGYGGNMLMMNAYLK